MPSLNSPGHQPFSIRTPPLVPQKYHLDDNENILNDEIISTPDGERYLVHWCGVRIQIALGYVTEVVQQFNPDLLDDYTFPIHPSFIFSSREELMKIDKARVYVMI